MPKLKQVCSVLSDELEDINRTSKTFGIIWRKEWVIFADLSNFQLWTHSFSALLISVFMPESVASLVVNVKFIRISVEIRTYYLVSGLNQNVFYSW